jgi:fatty acid synthase subunit alpha
LVLAKLVAQHSSFTHAISLAPSSRPPTPHTKAIRAQQAHKTMTEMVITNPLVKVKEAPPYTPELKVPVLMNPMARTKYK